MAINIHESEDDGWDPEGHGMQAFHRPCPSSSSSHSSAFQQHQSSCTYNAGEESTSLLSCSEDIN